MWYIWKGVKKPEDEPERSPPVPPNGTKRKPKGVHYVSALFDSTHMSKNDPLDGFCPSATQLATLWKQYLKNVHLLVMVFFDWEVEVLSQQACQNWAGLAPGEQALVLAVCFIATLSLSETECVNMLHDKQPQLLDKFQGAVENALLIAELTMTSDRLVLQAFMLYLVCLIVTPILHVHRIDQYQSKQCATVAALLLSPLYWESQVASLNVWACIATATTSEFPRCGPKNVDVCGGNFKTWKYTSHSLPVTLP